MVLFSFHGINLIIGFVSCRIIKGVAMKNTYEFNVLEKLDNDDKSKIRYFMQLLMQQSKYDKLKEEILSRKEEILQGEMLKHEDLWSNLDV